MGTNGTVALGHLRRMTDGTGLLQHARYDLPDRRHGYCLDDNARALWLLARMVQGGGEADELVPVYAAFVDHAWDGEAHGGRGRFRNFMDYDRSWLPDGSGGPEGGEDEDAHARALLALAHAATAPWPGDVPRWAATLSCEAWRAPSLPLAHRSPRAWAASLVAADALCGASDDCSGVLREARDHAAAAAPVLARRMVERFHAAARPDWPWWEEALAYDNARLCEGALAGARWEPALEEMGLASLRWLAGVQSDGEGRFRPFGNEGFGRAGVTAAAWDGQPIEAWASVDASLRAARVTGDGRWRNEAWRAHDWFVGANAHGAPLADRDTGSCADGLQRDGVNRNRGAESTLAWLHVALSARDGFDVRGRLKKATGERAPDGKAMG